MGTAMLLSHRPSRDLNNVNGELNSGGGSSKTLTLNEVLANYYCFAFVSTWKSSSRDTLTFGLDARALVFI